MSSASGDEILQYSVVLVTGPEGEMAELARKLVEAGLAACVNVLNGVRSIYWWEGRVVEDVESLLVIKTESGRLKDLMDFIRGSHPYEVPEIISLSIASGNPDYLRWVSDSVRRFGEQVERV
ncbi:MAG: divalent-cation tolerance protein CutA [Zestosphaera sp.]